MEAHLDAMRSYIRRKSSIIGYHQDNYLNLIKFSKRLLKFQHDKKELQLLYDEIVASKMFAERKWLLEWVQEAL